MTRRSQRLRLLDIAEQIPAIDTALAGRTEADMLADWLLRHAIERGIEINSEASRHLDPALKASHSEVPWQRVADIGNWLRHAYDRIEPALIVGVVTGHFPVMRAAVADMLANTVED